MIGFNLLHKAQLLTHLLIQINPVQTIINISSAEPKFPANMSPGAVSFIRAALQKDREDRPTMEQLSMHPWIVEQMTTRQHRNNSIRGGMWMCQEVTLQPPHDSSFILQYPVWFMHESSLMFTAFLISRFFDIAVLSSGGSKARPHRLGPWRSVGQPGIHQRSSSRPWGAGLYDT